MENDGPLLTIGELARRVGVPVRTIRFWSDSGLVPPAARTDSDRRLYDAACVARLELVTTLRELGLSLASALIDKTRNAMRIELGLTDPIITFPIPKDWPWLPEDLPEHEGKSVDR